MTFELKRPQIKKPLAKLPFPLRAPSTPLSVEPLPADENTGANYDTEWARSPGARAFRGALTTAVMKPAMTMLASPTVKGLDRLDSLDGPAIFAANHHSHLDTPLLITTIPEPWRSELVVGGAADYFFSSRAKGAVAALTLAAFPVERDSTGRKTVDLAAEMLDEGWSILIYPEGGRSPDGWGQPFRRGAAYLSKRCDVPVVPIHVEGTGRILRKGRKLPNPSTSKITFGAPVKANEGERTASLSERLEASVAELADEATTDWWTARQRAHAGTTPPMHGPNAGAWRRVWALDQDRRNKPKRTWPRL